MIGIALYTGFLRSEQGADISHVVAHIQHLADLLGSVTQIGLGSDMDGGFSPKYLPKDLQHPRDLVRLAEALSHAGFSDQDIRGLAHDHWQAFLKKTLHTAVP